MKALTESLHPQTGEISGLIFENPAMSVARDVYWSLFVEFAPVMIGDEEVEPALLADWLKLNSRTWRSLDAQVWNGRYPTTADEEGMQRGEQLERVEASFYTFEHSPVLQSRIELRQAPGSDSLFDVRWSALIDRAYLELDPGRMELDVQVRVRFKGVMIADHIVEPREERRELARQVFSDWLDIETFGSMEIETNEFGVSAWWLRP